MTKDEVKDADPPEEEQLQLLMKKNVDLKA
jgi:hypothetical protein